MNILAEQSAIKELDNIFQLMDKLEKSGAYER